MYVCTCMCRLTALEQEKVQSLQEVLKGKDELLEDIKRQYEGMAEARVERWSDSVVDH